MTLGLYMDDDTGLPELSTQARAIGSRVVRSDDLGMRGRSDEEHLRRAAVEGLAVVTCNRRDFLALHWRFLAREETHAGIIIVSQSLPKGERIRRLLFLSQLAEPSDLENRIELLKDWP